MRIKFFAVLCLLVAFIHSPLHAQDVTGDDAILAPYLTKTTVALVRVDFTKLDPASLDAFNPYHLFGENADPKKWMVDFTKAGGKRVYVVFDLALLPQAPFMFITPLAPGADAHALRNLVEHGNSNDAAPGGDRLPAVYIVANKLILLGDADALKKLPQLQASPRPGLLKALSTAGSGVLDAALESTDDGRKIFVPMFPPLTPEAGASTNDALLKGLTNIQLDLSAPLGTGIRLAVNCSSPEAVANVKAFLSAAIFLACENMLGTGKAATPEGKKFVDLLTPKEQGNSLALTWDNNTIQTQLVPILKAAESRAQGQAVQARSNINMHEMMMSLLLYENDHHGAYPDSYTVKDLAGAIDEKELARLMANPAHPDRNPGFVYIKPAHPKTAPTETIIIYETLADGDTDLNVCFVDGTVKRMIRADFDKAMARTKDINAGK